MKKLAFTLLSFMLLSFAAINASAQESRSVSGFNAVAASGPFNVHIKLNGTESVKVDADANIINDIETVVENGTLKIQFKDHRWNNHHDIHKAEIYVTAKALNSLVNSGSGSMNVENQITAGNFQAILSGSGNISTSVKAETLKTVISGSGSIKLSGSANDANFVVTGSGEIEGKGLKTSSAKAVITGSGNIHVDADKSVSAHITGSGSVVYSGNASAVDSRTTGSGRLTKED